MNVAWTGEGWDNLGSVVDLTPYLTKDEVNTELGKKANSSDVYTKTEVNNALANKLSNTDVIDGGTF